MANMHLVTGYAGTPHVTAADFGAFWAAIIGNGDYVLDHGQKFAATIVSNNLIRIADGELLMQGRHGRIKTGETVDLTIENGTTGMLRSDLIVARYTKSKETGIEDVNPVVILGTAAESSPADPEYITGDILAGDMQRDFPLFRVNLNGVTISSIDTLFEEYPCFADINTTIAELFTNLAIVEKTANTANANATSAVTTANAATKMKVGKYTGTGTYGSSNKTKLTLGFKPKFVMWFSINTSDADAAAFSILRIWEQSVSAIPYIIGLGDAGYVDTTKYINFTASNTALTWYVDYYDEQYTNIKAAEMRQAQLNVSDTVYYYIALG